MPRRWSIRQSLRAESRTVSITLEKDRCSIAIVFPRPSDWMGTRREDYQLVRRMLAEAAEALDSMDEG